MPPANASIPRTNAKFAAIATINDTERRIARRIEAVAGAVNDLAARLPDRKDWDGWMNRQPDSGKDIDRLCAAIERRDFARTARIAALCAAGFSTSGDIDNTTNVGKAMEEAGRQFKIAHLKDVAALAEKPLNRRKFVSAVVAEGGQRPGLAQRLTEEDVDRFVELAPALYEAMSAPPAAPGKP